MNLGYGVSEVVADDGECKCQQRNRIKVTQKPQEEGFWVGGELKSSHKQGR